MANPCDALDEVSKKIYEKLKETYPNKDDLVAAIDDGLAKNHNLKREYIMVSAAEKHHLSEQKKIAVGKQRSSFANEVSGDPGGTYKGVPLEAEAQGAYESVLAKLSDSLGEYKFGVREAILGRNPAMQADIVHAIKGSKKPVNKIAESLGRKFQDIAEELRVTYNRFGGAVKKLVTWDLPMMYDAHKILKAGRSTFKADILDSIDERLLFPYEGADGVLTKWHVGTPEEIDKILDSVYDALSTNGIKGLDPTKINPKLIAALGDRHQHHRILHHKDADGWIGINTKYGSGTPIDSMMSYMELMTRDITAMKRYGPNPDKLMAKKRALVQKMTGKGGAGKQGTWAYDNLMGKHAAEDGDLAHIGRTLRAVQVLTKLPFAMLSSLADPGFVAHAAARIGMNPISTVLKGFGRLMGPVTKENSKFWTRAGVHLDLAANNLRGVARITDLEGRGFFNKAADVSIRLSGLHRWTQFLRRSFQLDFAAKIADETSGGWDQMGKSFTRTMENYGFTPDDLVALGKAKFSHNGVDYIDPSLVEKTDLAQKYLGMLWNEGRVAMPESSARSRGLLAMGTKAGTPEGELVRTVTQFKQFGTSVMLSHLSRMRGMKATSAIGYSASLAGVTTMLGVMSVLSKDLAKGKYFDFDNANQKDWAGLFLRGFLQGGSMGIMGDIMFNDHSRPNSLASIAMGPTIGDMGKLAALTTGPMQAVFDEEKSMMEELGKSKAKGVRMAIRSVGTPWYTQLLMHRYFFDSLDRLADPNWDTRQSMIESRMETTQNLKYFSKP